MEWQMGWLVGKALVCDTVDLALIPALQLCDPPNASHIQIIIQIIIQIKYEY